MGERDHDPAGSGMIGGWSIKKRPPGNGKRLFIMPPKRKPHAAATLAPAGKAPKPDPYPLLWAMINKHWDHRFLDDEVDDAACYILADHLPPEALAFLKDSMELLVSDDNVLANEPNRAKKVAARDCMIEVEEEMDKVQAALESLSKKVRALHRIAEWPDEP